MKDIEKEILDYEHTITSKMKVNIGVKGFPVVEDYGFTRRELDDYLFDKQAILDSEGSEKSQYTVFGILVVLPVLICSAFPPEKLPGGLEGGLLISIAIGILLGFLYKAFMKLSVQLRLKKMSEDRFEKFIKDVLDFNK